MAVVAFGDASEVVLDRIDRMNPPGANGKRPITINAIGFPNLLRAGFSLGQSGVKFANLMRELTTIHGGAFTVVTGDSDLKAGQVSDLPWPKVGRLLRNRRG